MAKRTNGGQKQQKKMAKPTKVPRSKCGQKSEKMAKTKAAWVPALGEAGRMRSLKMKFTPPPGSVTKWLQIKGNTKAISPR